MRNAVHRAAGDADEVGDFDAGVLAVVVEGDEVFFLGEGELGWLAAEPDRGLRDLYAFASADEMRSDSTPATIVRT